ncbi:hypothetical protein ORI20_15030 [Mycobacterium sp. CVI_P3]|uniref:PE-PGRS family protein n=1 Tax=Mycobacterium pinniadriaticum TaxID=2994102 RepID=A0ABT3SEU3_9MYCO|nr:hypothetical protein [Mycobacterium pinniadriaticum]MCX2931593.1 hypothetical protein [Mycobacterium pinniadriaticum]MCX2938015.1 hypothetical protein [Mycobacterium pinniadriaticum]
MDVAVRSYLTAGVAVFGASAIALAPVQVTPPNLHLAQDRALSALADVSLSSLTDVIQAINDGWNGLRGGLNALNGAADTAITQLGDALQAALISGIGSGNTALQSVVDGLLNGGSTLAQAVDNALAEFPNPQAFISALVAAFGTIDVNLGLAIQAALNVSIQGAADLANALIAGGAALAAAFNAAVAAFPSPAAFVAALTDALAAINPTLGILSSALTTFTGQLADTIQAGIAAGLTGFQALLNALGNPASALAAAFQAVLEAFPNPAAFFNALVAAFSNIDVNLGLALQAALDLSVTGLQGFVDALVSGGATLAAAFNAALAAFPSPAAFVAALNGALAAINPALGALATAFTTFTGQLADTIRAGIAAGLTGFQALLNALGNPASALAAAFQAVLEAFPNPAAFFNALVAAFTNIDVNLGLALQAALNVGVQGLQGFVDALVSGGATLAAAFNAALANFPSPQAFVDALVGAFAAINPTLGILADAFTTFTGQLNETIQAGIAAGLTGFQALLDALGNPASALAAAFQAVLEAFPNPAAFFNALVAAFGNIDVNLGLALQAALSLGVDGLQGFVDALVSGGATLAAAFNAALANFPSPQAFVDALTGALAAINPTLGILANAVTNLTGELGATIRAGIAAGLTGFQAMLNALSDGGSALAAAFQAALAAFPNPQAFFSALVQAFSSIDVNLGLALQAALDLSVNGLQGFVDALVSGGATLAAAFNAALANFPSPQAFVDAFTGALAAINPTLGVLANAFTTFTGQLNETIQAGIAAGLTGFQALLDALGNPASALAAAFQAVLEAFPNPAAFFNALVAAFGNIDVNLGLALQAALSLGVDGLQGFVDALVSGGATLAAAFNAALANFPSPQAFVEAFANALAAINPTLGILTNTLTTLTGQLGETIRAGIAAGSTAFQSVIAALGDGGSALFAAFQAALESFPNPQAFINALVDAIGNINVNLALALQAALNVNLDGAQAIIDALANGGVELAAAFNAAVANFPSPEVFVDALTGALGGGLEVAQDVFNNGAALLTAGLNAGVAAGNALIGALNNGLIVGGAALDTAIRTALSTLPSPEAVVNALATAGAHISAQLTALAKSINAGLSAAININIGGIHIGGGIDVGGSTGAATLAAASAAAGSAVTSVNDTATSIAGNAPTVSLKVKDAPAATTPTKAAESSPSSADAPAASLPAPPKVSLPKVSLPAPPKVSLPKVSAKGSSDASASASAGASAKSGTSAKSGSSTKGSTSSKKSSGRSGHGAKKSGKAA